MGGDRTDNGEVVSAFLLEKTARDDRGPTAAFSSQVDRLCRSGQTHAAFLPYFPAGGTTFMTNEVGVSVGPNGPGAL
jgi:hypothetical protein